MKITNITKTDTNILVATIQDGDEERVLPFVISAPIEIINRFADSLAALIVLQNMESVE